MKQRDPARVSVIIRDERKRLYLLIIKEMARQIEAAITIDFPAPLGVGLRVFAVAHLKVDDIDSARI